jgi:hypothetical protein
MVSQLKQFAIGMIILGVLFVYFALTGWQPYSQPLSDLILFYYLPLIAGTALFGGGIFLLFRGERLVAKIRKTA